MEVASLSTIKRELQHRSHQELVTCILGMAKFRKENKELLNYLLFEAQNEVSYIEGVKAEMVQLFGDVNTSSVYFAKKTIRKILRIVNKHMKFSGLKQTEVELLIAFCLEFRQLNLPFRDSKVLLNIYERQLHNIRKAFGSLDEDLQFDYQAALKTVERPLR
jgi:hypothetical protein